MVGPLRRGHLSQDREEMGKGGATQQPGKRVRPEGLRGPRALEGLVLSAPGALFLPLPLSFKPSRSDLQLQMSLAISGFVAAVGAIFFFLPGIHTPEIHSTSV